MIDIEKAFLGSIIKHSDNLDVLGKAKRDWFSGNNKYVFDSIMYLFTNGMGVDTFTVSDKLKGLLGDKYKESIIEDIFDLEFNPANFETYQNRLEEECLRKVMVSEMYESIKDIEKASPGEVKSVVDESEGRIFQASQNIASKDALRKMGDVGVQVMKEIRSYKEDGVVPYMANTGLIDLDALIGGFKGGDYTIIAAASSMGKTALGIQMLRNNLAEGRAVGMISLEMTSEAVFLRHVSAESQIDSLRIRTGNINSNEFDRCSAAWKRINNMPFYIDDNSALNEVTIRGVARRMVQSFDIKLLVIDYVQEMECSQRRENRQQEISRISRSLKNLCKELKIPIIVLSQLSRKVEERNPPIPRLSDLRESGALEQDADNVIFIYRPEYYNLPTLSDGTTPSTGFAELIVGKARNARTGFIKSIFIKEKGTFESSFLEEDKNEEINN